MTILRHLNTGCGRRSGRHGEPLDDKVVAVGHGNDAQVISVAQRDVAAAASAPHDVRVRHGEAVRLQPEDLELGVPG